MTKLPTKLKDDAIVEAVAEARFESNELPEVILGRLSDAEPWRDFQKRRLPGADIPAPIRGADPNLKFQAAMELRDEQGTNLIKIGANVLSHHITGVHRYVGWDKFEPLLRNTFDILFRTVQNVSITRLGLRYTNALTFDRHLIKDVPSLNLMVNVGNDPVLEPLMLNFEVQYAEQHKSMTRIASPLFVKGQIPDDTTAIIDVDVYTGPSYEAQKLDDVIAWVKKAHDCEKKAFFRLLPDQVVKKLTEV